MQMCVMRIGRGSETVSLSQSLEIWSVRHNAKANCTGSEAHDWSKYFERDYRSMNRVRTSHHHLLLVAISCRFDIQAI